MSATTAISRLRQFLAIVAALTAMPAGAQRLGVNPDDVPPYSRRGADTCLSCHEDTASHAIFAGRHGNPASDRSPFGDGQLQCEACHGPGGEHAARVRRGQTRPPVIRFGKDSGTPVAQQNAQCLGCHEIDVGADWHAGVHVAENVACADCHALHAASDPVLATATQPDVCYGCHTLERSEAVRPFAHPLHEGKMDCSDCHRPHGSSAEFALARDTVNDTCFACHADKRGPFLWEHAPVAEDCSLCHVPHGANQPAMLRLRVPGLCQTCHAEQGHPSLAEGPNALAEGIASRFLLAQGCLNCHTQIHGSNHPSGGRLMR